MIYDMTCGDWTDALKVFECNYAAYNGQKAKPIFMPRKSTPEIFLVNHQITNEALPHLRRKPLIVSFGSMEWQHSMWFGDFLHHYIGRETIPFVPRIEIWAELHYFGRVLNAVHLSETIFEHQNGGFKTIHIVYGRDGVAEASTDLLAPNEYPLLVDRMQFKHKKHITVRGTLMPGWAGYGLSWATPLPTPS
ncbi:MAG: hypothetical protein M1820_007004 [Bogoriella megaspora]|nr:MAG: hypothetical protein M1820_007004 [Bogoriella megaspora]